MLVCLKQDTGRFLLETVSRTPIVSGPSIGPFFGGNVFKSFLFSIHLYISLMAYFKRFLSRAHSSHLDNLTAAIL